MKVYFLRHGETQYNLEMRMQGWIDIPLNDKGKEQAALIREKIKERGLTFDRVYSSPLIRARQTACIVSGLDQSDLRIDDRLIEMGFGKYEGLRFEHIPEDIFELIRRTGTDAAEEVESAGSVLERTRSFLDSLKALEGTDSILCVCHGVTLRSLYSHLNLDGSSIPWELKIGNCALYESTLTDGEFSPMERIL